MHKFLSLTSFIAVLVFLVAIGSSFQSATAQDKSMVKTALGYKPVQRTVDYDIPTKSEIDSCKIEKTLKKFKKPGFAIYDSSGRILRLFFDLDRDNELDSWSYFKDGIEVYRDIDSDFDGRADEFRWMGSAGTRHGKDLDKNGTIDRWIKISASEAGEEVFHAVRTSDSARFKRLLISSSELESLQLEDKLSKTVTQSIREASSKFESFAKSQDSISSRSSWTQFGSTRPALVPSGISGVTKDLIIFDHAAAVFENKGKFGQLSLGTIVEVQPNNWRILELPQLVGEGQVVRNGGLFYPAASPANESNIVDNSGNPDAQVLVKLFEEYDAISKQLNSARGAATIAKLEEQQADLFMQLAQQSKQGQEQGNWIRQMADTVTSSYQTNRFPKGLDFIQRQIPKIKSMGLTDELAYVQWRIIYAEFLMGHQQGDRKSRSEANEKYIRDLEKFVKQFPKSEFAAEGYFQLGLNAEVAERDDGEKAIRWYTKCRREFAATIFGKKSNGAIVRLSSIGKSLPFKGSTIGGKRFDLQASQFRDKIVVIHYWETECDSCIDGFEELQRLGAKYKSDLLIVGANLNEDVNDAKTYLSRNRSVNWPQLHAPGGAEKSPLALQLGVTTLPLTILVDQRGKLVDSNLPVDDLDREIQRLIRRQSSQANLRKPKR